MKFTKKKILITLCSCLLLFAGFLTYYNTQVNSLVKLGYTKTDARKMTNLVSIYNIVTRSKEKLIEDVSQQKKELLALGVSNTNIEKLDLTDQKLVSQVNALVNNKEKREESVTKQLTSLEQIAKKFNVKYQYPQGNCYQKYLYLQKTVTKNFDSLISKYKKYLLNSGYTNAELNKLTSKSKYTTVTTLKKYYDTEVKNAKDNNGFQNKNLKNAAMRMFRETNSYRKSLGLKPYTYNYSLQACVFKEAKAYASNKNPHNWLCADAANENAAVSSSSSDYVGIAMNFFKSDPPHEAVLSGNYNSVAIAFVEKNGTVYMIMDVFH